MESGCAEAAMADGAQAFSHDGAPERFQDSGKIQGKIPVCLEPPKNHQLNRENDGLVVYHWILGYSISPIFNSWYICSSAEMFPNLLRVFEAWFATISPRIYQCLPASLVRPGFRAKNRHR